MLMSDLPAISHVEKTIKNDNRRHENNCHLALMPAE